MSDWAKAIIKLITYLAPVGFAIDWLLALD